jgi:hypothetical protein
LGRGNLGHRGRSSSRSIVKLRLHLIIGLDRRGVRWRRRLGRRRSYSFGLLLGPAGTGWSGWGRGLIFFDKILGEDALLFSTGFIRVFTGIPLVILDTRDGYDLADWESQVILMVWSVLEDRFDRKRWIGHLDWFGVIGGVVVAVKGMHGL